MNPFRNPNQEFPRHQLRYCFSNSFFAIAACLFILTSCGKSMTDPIPESKQSNNSAEGFIDVNADNPGLETNINSSIVFGKYTVIEFTSPGCAACQQMKPYLMQLHDVRPDIVVRSYDVNRKGSDGIDWESPLTQQYGLHSLPAFKIFNEKGSRIAEGGAAQEQVRKVIENDILNHKNKKKD